MRHEDTKLYIADPKHEDHYYGLAYDLQEIDMKSTAGEVLQKSKELFPLAQKPFVVVKLFYVSTQNNIFFLSPLN